MVVLEFVCVVFNEVHTVFGFVVLVDNGVRVVGDNVVKKSLHVEQHSVIFT